MPGDPNTGFEVGETQVFPNGTYWDQYRIGGTSLSSPLMAGVVAVADQLGRRPLGFINPLYYQLLGSNALHDIVAPRSPVAQVRTEYANNVDPSQGFVFRLQTVDVQSSTLHDTRGYDDETGVGTPAGAGSRNPAGVTRAPRTVSSRGPPPPSARPAHRARTTR